MKIFLIYVVLNKPDKERIAEFVTDLREILKMPNELAFRSSEGDVFGYFIQTDKASGQIRAAIEGLHSTRNGDAIMVLGVAKDFNAIGNSRAWAWLQNRLKEAD